MPSAMPEPGVMSAFDTGAFTYDDYDDVLRDVRHHTFNQDVSSPSPDLGVGDRSFRERLKKFVKLLTAT